MRVTPKWGGERWPGCASRKRILPLTRRSGVVVDRPGAPAEPRLAAPTPPEPPGGGGEVAGLRVAQTDHPTDTTIRRRRRPHGSAVGTAARSPYSARAADRRAR